MKRYILFIVSENQSCICGGLRDIAGLYNDLKEAKDFGVKSLSKVNILDTFLGEVHELVRIRERYTNGTYFDKTKWRKFKFILPEE